MPFDPKPEFRGPGRFQLRRFADLTRHRRQRLRVPVRLRALTRVLLLSPTPLDRSDQTAEMHSSLLIAPSSRRVSGIDVEKLIATELFSNKADFRTKLNFE